MVEPVVSAREVEKRFASRSGTPIVAVKAASLEIAAGQTVGLIGESGSGKSTLGRLVLGLLQPDTGEVRFHGTSLASLTPKQMRALRSKMQVVFQEPFESLNPRLTVGRIVREPLDIHEPKLPRTEKRRRVMETLEAVGLGAEHARRLPAAMSGGQQQRVGIARAIVTRPDFVLLDEPTSSLDLSVRAQILNLLVRLQSELSLAYLFISHDISTIQHISHTVAVMYLGRIVETGAVEDVLGSPRHPYTQALLSARLSAEPDDKPAHFPLRGEIPGPAHSPPGCVLVGRCPIEIPECSAAPVPLQALSTRHAVACIRADDPAVSGDGSAVTRPLA